jgi:hypothetical protein
MLRNSCAYSTLSPDKRPLLICNDLVLAGHESEEPASWRTCLHNSALILARARSEHWLIAHVYRLDRRPVPIATVRPTPEEPVFQCSGPSALTSRGLRDLLATRVISELILVGRSLVPSCVATAVAAADMGLAVTLVADAVSLRRSGPDPSAAHPSEYDIQRIPDITTLTTTAKILELPPALSLIY